LESIKKNWAKIVALLVEKFEILIEHNNDFLMCHEVVIGELKKY
jgi:hypothetical protein